MSEYSLERQDQAGAEQILRQLGALAEIESAVLAHCQAGFPRPPYKPQEIKRHLAPVGWLPEKRVPPFSPAFDHLRGNERFDLFKAFEHDGSTIGVAIEIERWEIQNDLLKMRRGLERGLIGVGVILSDGPKHLAYCFDHLRLVSEPLFGEIPILFCAPAGPGIE